MSHRLMSVKINYFRMTTDAPPPPVPNAWGDLKGNRGQYTLTQIIRAQSDDGTGFTTAQKEKAKERMVTLRWCARPNKKSQQKPNPTSILEEFVVQKKCKKKCKSPAAAPINPWSTIAAAVYNEPSALQDIMAEQGVSPLGAQGPLISSSLISDPNFSAKPVPTEPSEKVMPKGVWSLSGWKTDAKIQGELHVARLFTWRP